MVHFGISIAIAPSCSNHIDFFLARTNLTKHLDFLRSKLVVTLFERHGRELEEQTELAAPMKKVPKQRLSQ